MLITRFTDTYQPGRMLSIDESMVLWRGRLTFRQYMPGKRHKYGLKLYVLCESGGYVLKVIVYCGKMDQHAGISHAESIVLDLLQGRLNLGHHLYIDNFYTSIPLARQLLRNGTLVCGTLRHNWKQLPPQVTKATLKKGDVIRRCDGKIVILKWHDKRDVLMLSTIHRGDIIPSGKMNTKQEPTQKPDCILAYNTNMAGIDRSDQMTSYYDPLRKSLKWYRKLVLHMFDVAVVNGFLLYKKPGGYQSQKWFRLQLIDTLLKTDYPPESDPAVPPRYSAHPKSGDPSRLVHQHYMHMQLPAKGRKHTFKNCVVCTKAGLRQQTAYFCKTCASKPAMCVVPCFETLNRQLDL